MEPGQRERRRTSARADIGGRSSRLLAADRGRRGRHARPAQGAPREIIDPKIAGHRGRIVKTTGDGLLVEFASVVDAVRCAAEVQVGWPNAMACCGRAPY